ncbi:hypothetical protein LCGC14_2579590 [marine sediment metagenome]|uniref:Uncharacterized protein n=1 Tax=marine sediment metagenome TaxID=412755 RepID=A0A0F9AF58_9ZZZZ
MSKSKLSVGICAFVGELAFLGLLVWLGLKYIH